MQVRQYLIIMVKQPRVGAVKTRLGKDIGFVPAAYFFRYSSYRIIRRLMADRRWQTVLAVAPDQAAGASCWPMEVRRIAQGGGDLGARMQRVFDRAPPGRVVIIGTDIPQITCGHVARAFTELGSHEVVFGPADDGGYWLVGQRRSPKVLRIFDNVRWSSEHTLTDTLANLNGHSVAQTEVLRDVDTVAEYRELKKAGALVINPI